MEKLPIPVMAREVVERFEREDPFYKLFEEYGGRNYIAYSMTDAAIDVLVDSGVIPSLETLTEIHLLESAAKRLIEVGNYTRIMRQRYELQDDLNQIFDIHPDRG